MLVKGDLLTMTATPPASARTFVLQDREPCLRPEVLSLDAPRADEVLVEVAACGVCHTDLHVLKDEVAFPRPAVLGHEISGVVLQVGDRVTRVKPGDRVACSFIMPCGRCRHCERGISELCEVFFTQNRLNGRLLDGTTRLHRADGSQVAMYSMSGHADRAVVPVNAVFPLPDEVSLPDAAILGCSIFTGYGAVYHVGEVGPGDDVVVVAAGGIGLSIIHLARVAGATNIIAVDIDDEKLALARELGATATINSTVADPATVVTQLLGHGATVVFEALGSTATTKQAVDLVDDGGRVVLAGIAPAGHLLEVEITKLVRRKIQIRGCFGAPPAQTMPKVIELAATGALEFSKLITNRYRFDQIDQAYQDLANRRIRGRGVVQIGGEQTKAM